MTARADSALRFCGAAGGVTGSKHLVTWGKRSVLLDCGMFQGLKELRLRNWEAPPFDPARLDAVVLSHAHLDHSGYLPVLVRRGFRGPIHCTKATKDLLRVMLLDAARLQEEQAEQANRHGFTKHHPALPLFTTEDAEAALRLLVARRYEEPFALHEAQVLFRPSGHILGSASVQLDLPSPQLRVVFSGDLGRPNQPILVDPAPVPEADVLLLESTYGDRVHPQQPKEMLARVVREASARGGALLVPAFAVGRTQVLLWLLHELELEGRIPRLPVFIDSPMANEVSRIYCRHDADHDESMREAMAQDRCPLCSGRYTAVADVAASKALNHRTGPMIVIAGNGMATGGRILHHLKLRLGEPRTTVMLVGFQAEGTRGRALRDGASEVKLHGRFVPVRAKIEVLDGLSAHADRDETLAWLGGFVRPPKKTWLVHGEPAAAASLAALLSERLQWNAEVAVDGAEVPLS